MRLTHSSPTLISSALLFTIFLRTINATTPSFHWNDPQSDGSGDTPQVLTGLENLLRHHTDLLREKNIGIVTNHTGVDQNGIPIWKRISEVQGANVQVLFSPEHGLFGEAAAGEKVNYEDSGKTEYRYYSLYGSMIKPTPESLEGIDLLIYDIQDIGTRSYTFITTLGLILEAAGEAGLPILVLDRPNPLTGVKIDGPALNIDYRSFVGFYPIPMRYGLTPGELAKMMIDKGWIEIKPLLKVIPLISWNRDNWYDETNLNWIKPSPNIPNLTTAIVYPGTVFLEATNISEGRGTDRPFLCLGAPWIDGNLFSREMNKKNLPGVLFGPVQFTPEHLPGIANNPKYEGIKCQGIEISLIDRNSFKSVETGITILITVNELYPNRLKVRTEQLNRLVGSDLVSRGLQNNWSVSQIISEYQNDIEKFFHLREKYLLY